MLLLKVSHLSFPRPPMRQAARLYVDPGVPSTVSAAPRSNKSATPSIRPRKLVRASPCRPSPCLADFVCDTIIPAEHDDSPTQRRHHSKHANYSASYELMKRILTQQVWEWTTTSTSTGAWIHLWEGQNESPALLCRRQWPGTPLGISCHVRRAASL